MATGPDKLTYTESRYGDVFDWNAFLNKEADEDDWEDARERASNWVTCACGNQCAVLPRNKYGCPKDAKLKSLGLDFMYAIDNDNTSKAKDLLAQIEERSAYLLACPNYTAPDAD